MNNNRFAVGSNATAVSVAESLSMTTNAADAVRCGHGGIYAIRNQSDGSVYIGSTGRFETRWAQHRRMLLKGNHHCRRLQAAFDAEGDDSLFEFVALQTCGAGEMLACERKWISIARRLMTERCYNDGIAAPGRPAGGQVRMSFTLDPDLLPWMEREAKAAGYTMKRSGKPNVSGWLNAILVKMEIQSRII